MGTQYNPAIVTGGLVLALDAANIKSYPGSGSTWFDLSGRGNHATLFNTPTFANRRALFDGTNQYAEIAYNATNFTFSYEQTIMIVLSPTESDGLRRNPYNQSYGGSGTWTHETSGAINFYYGQNATGVDGSPYTNYSSSAVSQNETAVMCTVRSAAGNFRKWFKNGVNTYTENNVVYNPVSNSTSPIKIGNGYAGYYMGYIDLVLLYNTSLTNSQVAQNFNALRGRYNI